MDRGERFARELMAIRDEIGEPITISHVSVRTDTIYRSGEPIRNQRRREVWELLYEAGLCGVYLGIESGSPRQLRRYCKGATVEENLQAMQIMREIGLDVEVGFIFFDPLANLDDLEQNLDFISKTGLYKTSSRLFGSLRVQSCTPYYRVAQKRDLVGKLCSDTLIHDSRFQDPDVAFVEETFSRWEAATLKLVKQLPLDAVLLIRERDFFFVRDLLDAVRTRQDSASMEKRHAIARGELLECLLEQPESGRLLREYLVDAISDNQALIDELDSWNLAKQWLRDPVEGEQRVALCV
jgi:hypothetical protein